MRTALALLLTLAIPALSAERMVDAGGHRLHILVSGEGRSTVVLESGFGSAAEQWKGIVPEIAKFARVVSYDRAGLGTSEAAFKPRTASEIAKDLHAALQRAKIKPPYILVSHSAGGASMRLFARLFPKDVAGMVLLDPPMEEFLDWLKVEHPDMDAMPPERLAMLPPGIRAEWDARDASIEEMRAAFPLPKVPVILVSSAHYDQAMAEGLGAEALDVMRAARAHWLARVPGAQQIVAEKGGHDLPRDEPELVVRVIRQVIEESGLRAPGAR